MNKTHLMNSAMMPAPGRYELQEISEDVFMGVLAECYYNDTLINCIGYPQNLYYIRAKTGIKLHANRDETHIQPGDTMLIMKLRYRVRDAPKGQMLDEEGFVFFRASFDI